MKLSRLRPKFHKLNARGIAHITVPLVAVLLVAVVGTFMLVSSHAQEKTADLSTATAAAKKSTAKTKKGYMIVYSQGGRFNQVKIQADAIDVTTHKCGGSFSASKDYVVRKLKAKKGIKIACSAVGGKGQYDVYFGKNGKFNPAYVAVNIDGGYCTIVHFDPVSTRMVPFDKNGKCQSGEADSDTPTKQNVDMRVLPKLSSSKKRITGYVEVNVPNEDVTRVECAGQINVRLKSASFDNVFSHPIKYAKVKGTQHTYCASRLNLGGLKPGTYTVSAEFPGNTHLNPGSATASNTITIPAPAKKKN